MTARSHYKKPCPDCHQCQWCSDSRCALCLGEKGCGKKLSVKEQIALYEKINQQDHPPPPDCGKNKR